MPSPRGSRTGRSENDSSDEVVAFLERSCVALSLGLGGVGLASLKLIVYLATGSVLVRASMFDSLGDIFSSLIMVLTQWKASDTSDMHRYPMGKKRFVPLGVLFFCAFMCSTMLSMALESLQAFGAGGEPETEVPSVPAGPDMESVLRQLFAEKRRLRWVYSPQAVQAMIVEYGTSRALGTRTASVVEPASSSNLLPTAMLGFCVLVKMCLFMWCKFVGGKKGSEIVSTLATDHRNDTITNAAVTATMIFLRFAEGAEWGGQWVDKVDAGVSLVLSLWIVKGWVVNALDQFKVLSDERIEEEDEVDAVSQAARTALQGSGLQFKDADVYHMGEGYCASLELRPVSANTEAGHIAVLVSTVENAVKASCGKVQRVDVHLRPQVQQPKGKRTISNSTEDHEWVKEYKV